LNSLGKMHEYPKKKIRKFSKTAEIYLNSRNRENLTFLKAINQETKTYLGIQRRIIQNEGAGIRYTWATGRHFGRYSCLLPSRRPERSLRRRSRTAGTRRWTFRTPRHTHYTCDPKNRTYTDTFPSLHRTLQLPNLPESNHKLQKICLSYNANKIYWG